jgi:four helix bundle protein
MDDQYQQLLNNTLDFSIEILGLCKTLNSEEMVFFTKPLFENTTNMGREISEAFAVRNNRNYQVKLLKAEDEAREVLYWLNRIEKDVIVRTEFRTPIGHCEELIRMICQEANSRPGFHRRNITPVL